MCAFCFIRFSELCHSETCKSTAAECRPNISDEVCGFCSMDRQLNGENRESICMANVSSLLIGKSAGFAAHRRENSLGIIDSARLVLSLLRREPLINNYN